MLRKEQLLRHLLQLILCDLCFPYLSLKTHQAFRNRLRKRARSARDEFKLARRFNLLPLWDGQRRGNNVLQKFQKVNSKSLKCRSPSSRRWRRKSTLSLRPPRRSSWPSSSLRPSTLRSHPVKKSWSSWLCRGFN